MNATTIKIENPLYPIMLRDQFKHEEEKKERGLVHKGSQIEIYTDIIINGADKTNSVLYY